MGDGTWEVGDVRWEMGVGHGRLEMAMGDWGSTCFCGNCLFARFGASLPPGFDVNKKDKKYFALLAVAGSQDQPSLPPCFLDGRTERVMSSFVFLLAMVFSPD